MSKEASAKRKTVQGLIELREEYKTYERSDISPDTKRAMVGRIARVNIKIGELRAELEGPASETMD